MPERIDSSEAPKLSSHNYFQPLTEHYSGESVELMGLDIAASNIIQ